MHSSPTSADVSCHIEAVANNSDSELAADVVDCNETEVSIESGVDLKRLVITLTKCSSFILTY